MLESDWIILLVNNLEPVVIAIGVGLFGAIFQRLTGRRLEGMHRQALHMAIQTAVRTFVNRWLLSNPGKTIYDFAEDKEATNRLRDVDAPAYLIKSVPEAMKKLSPLPDVLDDLIISYLPFTPDDRKKDVSNGE